VIVETRYDRPSSTSPISKPQFWNVSERDINTPEVKAALDSLERYI
jgi:hypothetical protein